MSQSRTPLLKARRPILRVQLTLLYSGLVLAIIIVVLFATNLLYQHSEARAPLGATGNAGDVTHQFDSGPALIGLAAAVLATVGAWWLAGRFLRPLGRIASAAEAISVTNLHQRLDLAGPRDELTDLGAVLNQLFARLEAAFEAQRRFVANASHELRTPLAGQRTLLQVALADPDATVDTLRSACGEALELGSQQERLIDALLTLATSERGIEHHEGFDLAEITQTVLNSRAQGAERRDIHIEATLTESRSTGDPRLVERLIANLIDNAIIHNFTGGTVEVSTNSLAGQSTLRVENTGPHITAEAVDHLFQPFAHVGRERVRNRDDGHGLGLAIVQAVAQAHGATLIARPGREGGLEIEVRFTAQSA